MRYADSFTGFDLLVFWIEFEFQATTDCIEAGVYDDADGYEDNDDEEINDINRNGK